MCITSAIQIRIQPETFNLLLRYVPTLPGPPSVIESFGDRAIGVAVRCDGGVVWLDEVELEESFANAAVSTGD